MNCHYSCSPTTTMTTTTTTPYDPIAVCEGSCDSNCDTIENHFQRNQCLFTCYNDCSTSTTTALTTTTTPPITTTTHPFAICHDNCEVHCAKYKNHEDELICLSECFTNCIPTTTATTTPSASEICYADCNSDCPEYDSICLVACYQECLVLIPTTTPALLPTTATTTTTSATTTSTTTTMTTSTSTSTSSTTTSLTTEKTVQETEKSIPLGWLEQLGLAVMAAVMTVITVVLFYRGENIYKWCRRGCRPKKSKSRSRKIRHASPDSSEHLLDEKDHELNLIKAQNKRMSIAINKINDQENERLREQLRRVERVAAVEAPFYPPEYTRTYDQTGRRQFLEPRTNSYPRRTSLNDRDEYYREATRTTRFDKTVDPVQRRDRTRADEETTERYHNEPARPVKSNLITDQRRQYARKKSTSDLNRKDETDQEPDEQPERKVTRKKKDPYNDFSESG